MYGHKKLKASVLRLRRSEKEEERAFVEVGNTQEALTDAVTAQ